MAHVTFLVKQILKNKLSYIPYFLILSVCLGTLFLNHQTYKKMNLGTMAQQTAMDSRQNLEKLKQDLKTLTEGDDGYAFLISTIASAEEFVSFDLSRAAAFEQSNWEQVYKLELESLRRIEAYSGDSMTTSFQDAVERDKLKFTKLSEKNLPYEDEYLPTTATQFTLSIFRYILPALLPVGLAYVLTNLYGSAYEGKLDKNRLLPQSLVSVVGKNICVGSLYSLLTLLMVLGPVVLVSGLFYGWGNLNYPILFYSLTTKEMFFSAIGQVILPTILLHALSLVFMTVLIYLITVLTKNKMTALFISTIVLLSGIALPSVLAPVSAVAHLIPTTYVRSFDITTGVFQHGIENFQVNTGLGIGVLILSTLVLSLLCLLAQKTKNNLRITA